MRVIHPPVDGESRDARVEAGFPTHARLRFQRSEPLTERFVRVTDDHEGGRVHLPDDGFQSHHLGACDDNIQNRTLRAGKCARPLKNGNAAQKFI